LEEPIDQPVDCIIILITHNKNHI